MTETVGLSVEWCRDVLKQKLPGQDSEAYAPVLRAKGQAAQTILMLAAKTQENSLRKQYLGRLPELIKEVQEEERKIRLLSGLMD